MVASEYPPKAAGVGYYVQNLSKKLVWLGHEITVLTRGNISGWSFEDDGGISVVRTPFIPMPPFHIAFHSCFINSFLRKKKFDVIHYHSPLIPKTKSDRPKIATFHSCWRKEAETYEKATDIYSLYVKLFKNYFAKTEQDIIDDSTILTSVSRSLAEELRRYYKLKGKEVEVVGNAVDVERFRPKTNRRDGSILYAGRLVYRKGVLDLLEAAGYVVEKKPDARFIVVGGGPLLPHMKKEAKKKRLEKNIVFSGPVSQDELIKYYQTASIYVLPAHYEGLPTTLLEAMACGMPVVATNIPAISSVMEGEDVGFLVSPKKPEELSQAIVKLLGDEDLSQRMGEKARKLVEEKYNWGIVVEGIMKKYDELLTNQ